MISRRGFLGSLLAAAVLDPERLLWIPGEKTIFIPPARIVSFEYPQFQQQYLWTGRRRDLDDMIAYRYQMPVAPNIQFLDYGYYAGRQIMAEAMERWPNRVGDRT